MTVLEFKKPAVRAEYRPDPRNGEVYATESHVCRYVGDEEIQTFDGFAVVHMSRSGDSGFIDRGYASMDEALAGALRRAKECNAVFLSDQGGNR